MNQFCTNCGAPFAGGKFCSMCGAQGAPTPPPLSPPKLHPGDEFVLMSQMTDNQRLLFVTEMNARRKNPTTGLLLCLFLSGVGGHHFYLGNAAFGVLYLLFFWTFIPVIISLIELFVITGRVHRHNEQVAWNIAQRVTAMPITSVATAGR